MIDTNETLLLLTDLTDLVEVLVKNDKNVSNIIIQYSEEIKELRKQIEDNKSNIEQLERMIY